MIKIHSTIIYADDYVHILLESSGVDVNKSRYYLMIIITCTKSSVCLVI